MAPEVQKHRTSLHKTSVLLRQNIGTFPQRSPMFLISGTGKNDSYGSLYGVFYKLGWGDFRRLRSRLQFCKYAQRLCKARAEVKVRDVL